jgi:hypothetical protein
MSQIHFTDDPVVLHYRRRAESEDLFSTPPYEEKMSSPTWDYGVTLSNSRIGRRDVLRCLGQRDNEEARRIAVNAVNDLSQRFGDVVTGNPTVELSDEGLFPSYDTQALPTAVQITYARQQIVDTQWTALFQVQDRRDQKNRQFTIEDVYSAASFKQYADGQEIEVRPVYGDSETFKFNIYAGGLQWSQFWEDWQDMWRENDGTAMMQARYGQKQSERAYAVLTAGSPGTTSYEDFDGSGSTSITNDVATFNKAAETILNDMYTNTTLQGGQDVGESVEEEFQNPNFYILVSQFDSTLMTRVGRALQASYDAPNDNQSSLETAYPMQMIATPHVSTGTWYMVFPGRKNVAAIARDMTMFEKTDVQVAGVADANIAQGAYRMVRGDANQVQEMATS